VASEFKFTFVLRAVDRVGKTLDRINSRFPKMSRAVKRGAAAFAILQRKTLAAGRALNKFGKGMVRVGKSMSTKLTAPIGLAGVAIVRTAVLFKSSMNRVGALTRTIIGGVVDPAFTKLEEKAKMLGATTAFSASEVADAMGFLAQAGFKANQILEAIAPTLNLAAASNTGLAPSE